MWGSSGALVFVGFGVWWIWHGWMELAFGLLEYTPVTRMGLVFFFSDVVCACERGFGVSVVARLPGGRPASVAPGCETRLVFHGHPP